MAEYIEAIDELKHASNLPSIFLAGGITGCPDWQAEMTEMLDPLDILIINPRNPDFDVTNPNMSELQMQWEHRMLRRADEIMFWFPKETLCPITLYELGYWTDRRKKIYIGIEDGYARTEDVEVQTKLCNQNIPITHSLRGLAEVIKNGFNL